MDGNTKQIIERETNMIDNDLGYYDDSAKTAKDIDDNHSGRLVEYSTDTDSDASTQERVGARAGDVSPHPAPSTPASPSPSPEQTRRNAQGEAVLGTFGSRAILYLLGEAMRREDSIRQSALQRVIRDAGAFWVSDSIPTIWSPNYYLKIYDVNNFKVSQKIAGYMAHNIKTWAQAKEVVEREQNSLAIFACGAGVINTNDPFEMRRLRHELEQCLPPLQMSNEMREFVTAPTPPPAVPIPFPRGLFSPVTTPGSPFRFPRSSVDRESNTTGKKTFCMKRRQKKIDEMFNDVVLGVAGRRVAVAGRRVDGDQSVVVIPPVVPGIAPVPAPVPVPTPTPAPVPPPAPTPLPVPAQCTSPAPAAPTPTPAPVPPQGETERVGSVKRRREECCAVYQGGRYKKKRRLDRTAPVAPTVEKEKETTNTPFLVA